MIIYKCVWNECVYGKVNIYLRAGDGSDATRRVLQGTVHINIQQTESLSNRIHPVYNWPYILQAPIFCIRLLMMLSNDVDMLYRCIRYNSNPDGGMYF